MQSPVFGVHPQLFAERCENLERPTIRFSGPYGLKQALQGAGLVARRKKRGSHRRRRPRRSLPGMLLHIDSSKHRWFSDRRYYDLLVILDDATSEIDYAQLVEEESSPTVMIALREVIETKGLFCALYSDRGSHFFVTRKAGEKVDPHRLTQVGRAMKAKKNRPQSPAEVCTRRPIILANCSRDLPPGWIIIIEITREPNLFAADPALSALIRSNREDHEPA